MHAYNKSTKFQYGVCYLFFLFGVCYLFFGVCYLIHDCHMNYD